MKLKEGFPNLFIIGLPGHDQSFDEPWLMKLEVVLTETSMGYTGHGIRSSPLSLFIGFVDQGLAR